MFNNTHIDTPNSLKYMMWNVKKAVSKLLSMFGFNLLKNVQVKDTHHVSVCWFHSIFYMFNKLGM